MKNYMIYALSFLYLICFPLLGIAQEGSSSHYSESASQPGSHDPSVQSFPSHDETGHLFGNSFDQPDHDLDHFQGRFSNMLLLLALIIAFMIIAAWALKRMMKTRLMNMNTSHLIKIIETRPLSPRSTLYLIEVNGESLLIAETPTAVTHLASSPLDESLENEKTR